MEFLIFLLKGQAKIEARKRKKEMAKWNLVLETKQQLEIANKNGDELTEANLMMELGNIYAYYSDLDLSEAIYRQGLAIARAISDKELEAIALINLGSSHKQRLKYEQAYSYFAKALKISKELNDQNIKSVLEGHVTDLIKMMDMDRLSKK
ncbi:MAG: tetratricopeptide repeat protein [Chloroflexi bacterium]|nr:tetratricopeptide repeat protein [Chloroflexota bacterium]